jgi:predicted polyphosphate/ATP-dependent NAD kinase
VNQAPVVGIVANPVSARDIRRLIANASGLQIADRVNIVMRLLAALAAVGIDQVLMMPDRGGIRSLLQRHLQRSRSLAAQPWPTVRYVEMPVTGTVEDTLRAADAMIAAKVAAIIVLGGDGTHRAVVSRCGQIPITGLSTGTNNAFPELREPTITGLATGLYADGQVPDEVACCSNKVLRVEVDGAGREASTEIALVDVAITSERFVGARAIWKTDGFRELFVTFAEADAIGMSSIAGLMQPIARRDRHGLRVVLEPAATAARRIHAPITPGLMGRVGIRDWQILRPGRVVSLAPGDGSIALDGEREIEFDRNDRVNVCLHSDAFRTLDVARIMRYAAERQLLLAGKLAPTTPMAN